MTDAPAYDTIGRTYTATRRTDPRIAAAILAALGDARSVVNVGAGAGAYEPRDRAVVAVEPSAVMIAQRPADAARAVQACAEALPFGDASFDAALAILTIHHWSDQRRGVAELCRVARRRVVILTWDPAFADGFWLVRDYFPGTLAADTRRFPPLERLAEWLGPVAVEPVLVPADCEDGFFAAFWRRPEAYLRPEVRAGNSNFASMDEREVEHGVFRLEDDLRSGRWHEVNRELLDRDEFDAGYRLVIAELGPV
jgi:SAM-dependent methyltransferase